MTVFRVWAPDVERVDVEVAGTAHEMRPVSEGPVGEGPVTEGPVTEGTATGKAGWWEAEVDAPQEVDYAFRLAAGPALPDPRSPRQPDGPTGPSRTIPPHADFRWTDSGWRGMPLPGAVIYEVHVGTFTPEGTLDAAIGKLAYLAGLGVTAVELMPLAAFPGRHGWGYDGIGLWAVHEPYGGPAALKRFVDACHSHHMAVVLDVVYNHVGPGSRLADFGPYFTTVYATPWGPAINLDQAGSDEVRAFCVENALMWLRDYHVDGLRLDAVHALQDRRAVPFLEELATEVDALAAATGRSIVLIAESDLNDPRLITARQAGGYGLAGQWNDDFHHALHATVTGERQGYYADYGSLAALAKTLTGAYFHDGGWSSFRGRSHGRPVDRARTPAYRFTGFLQDHDQVGNRATGDRIAVSLSPRLLRVAAGIVLTTPFTPMLFMGEEWGADTPFQFFTDHTDPYFAQAVSTGRRAEFARHGWAAADVPDPQDPQTYLRSKLDWTQPAREPYATTLEWYRQLIALRRACPEITDPRLDRVRVDYDEDARWLLIHRGTVRIAANLSPGEVRIPLGPARPADAGRPRLLISSAPGATADAKAVTLPAESFVVTAVR